MTITPGSYYRRKSDGAKLMACECDQHRNNNSWWYYVLERVGNNIVTLHPPHEVEPWVEPKKKVKLWPALIRSTDGRHFLSNYLWPECPPDAVRLAVEYPAIEVE